MDRRRDHLTQNLMIFNHRAYPQGHRIVLNLVHSLVHIIYEHCYGHDAK